MSSQVPTGGRRKDHADPATGRTIFRAEALQHYQENQDRVELPPLASPRAFLYLWLLAGGTMALGLLLAGWSWIGALVAGAA